MPSTPIQCWTRNVIWNPMNMSQNWILPIRLFSILPVIFGHQK